MGMNRFGNYSMSQSPIVPNNFEQPSEPRHPASMMDAESEQKLINDLPKILNEIRGLDEKSQHLRSMRCKTEFPPAHSDGRDDPEGGHSPVPRPAIQSHPSLAQSPHLTLAGNEQPIWQVNSHLPSQMRPDTPMHRPPPAHAMSQPANAPWAVSQTPPPHGSQVPDQYLMQRYPVVWQGLLALKNNQAAVQMHFVSGNLNIARASLPPIVDGDTSPVRIALKMRLEHPQLEGVKEKIQMSDKHCVLMALPCGKDHLDVLQQSSSLKTGFINYLLQKQVAGIVNAAPPGCQQPTYVIHIFPTCEFTENNLMNCAPDLLRIISEIAHLVIVIATM